MAPPTQPFPFSPHPWKHGGKWVLCCLGAVAIAFLLGQIRFVALLQPLQDFVFTIEDFYHRWFEAQGQYHPIGLLFLAFGGGLAASLSPCILAMLPVHLSYIGTQTITSRWEALVKAGAFILGVVTILSLLGLFSALATAVMVQYRGYVYIAVGWVILLLGLNRFRGRSLPSLSRPLNLPRPYGVGLIVALVSTPCSSPLMFAILAAAAATGSQFWSTAMMASYALGYTLIIFLASLFAGFAKRTRRLLPYGDRISRWGSGGLMVLGLYYLVDGVRWVWAIA